MGRFVISPDEAMAASPRFVDARWYLPTDGRKGAEEYAKGHLPGAVLFDLDDVITPSTDHPHRAPGAERMAGWLGEAGISPGDDVVIYDESGFFSAPRLWFLMRALGHAKVRVLDGGLSAWQAAGGKLTTETPLTMTTDYPVPEDLVWPVVGREMVSDALASDRFEIADARPAGRFAGLDPEPRPGLPSGHMPGAVNVPFSQVATAAGRLKTPEELAALMAAGGLSPDRQTIVTCGSGVSACVLALALAEAGWDAGVWLYDGSWIDWASQPGAAIVTD